MMGFYIGMVTDNYLECTAIPRGPYIKGILLFDHHAGLCLHQVRCCSKGINWCVPAEVISTIVLRVIVDESKQHFKF